MRMLAVLLLGFVGGLAACGSPIVGADCKHGLTACDHACVDINRDYQNCGACGNDCGRFLCENGMCTSNVRPDGGAADGGSDAGLDASLSSQPDAGFNSKPGLGGCRIGQQSCSGTCSNPLSDPKNCGTCGHACPAHEVCSEGTCEPKCGHGLVACRGVCIDASGDPENCGQCQVECLSGLCSDNACDDALAGYAVVVGHDMINANNSMNKIAGGAVFLGRGNPVRVLDYRGDADPSSIVGVENAIDSVKSATGRDWQRTDAIESIVPLQLNGADVFLIHAQSKARKSTLQKLGMEWGDALAQFVARGGVVVLFDGPSTLNDGTFRVLEPAKIFSAVSRHAVPDQQPLKVVGVGFGVAMYLADRYVCLADTSSFQGVSTPGTIMVEDANKDPVVIERVIVPGGP